MKGTPPAFGRTLGVAFIEVLCVNLDKVLPLRGHVGVGEDGFNRTRGYACAAVDANFGIDVEHLVFVLAVYTIHWTHIDARFVLGSNARFGNDVRHILGCKSLLALYGAVAEPWYT